MLSLSDVEAARERIDGVVRRTPLEYSSPFSGADVRLKLENFQRTGAFKLRGATSGIETRGHDHIDEVLGALDAARYGVEGLA